VTVNAQFSGSIPEYYDRHMGPVLFEHYAEDLAARLARVDTGAVLETACGSGILTRRLRARLPAGVALIATDLSPAMIEHARKRMDGIAGIEWRTADAAALPFEDARFNGLACQFGVMFVPDKDAAFREARRVLAPGGTFVFNVWDGMASNRHAAIVQDVVAGFIPDDPPRFFHVPYGFHDRDTIEALLARHRFEAIRYEALALEASAESARSFALGLLRGTPMANSLAERGIAFDPVVDATARALADFGGAAPFRAPIRAYVCSARAA
jgi:SAM-dependent methyltransferase